MLRLSAVVILVTGCGDFPSLDLTPRGPESVHFRAQSDGQLRNKVTACPVHGGFLAWGCDETAVMNGLEACTDGRCASFMFVPTATLADGRTRVGLYEANLDGAPPGPRFAVSRGARGAEASVTLPANFSIVSPPEGARFSTLRDDIRVAWSPPALVSERVSWSVATRCSDGSSFSGGPVAGGRLTASELTIPARALELVAAGRTCTLTIEIRVTADGTVDASFTPAASIDATQSRSRVLELIP